MLHVDLEAQPLISIAHSDIVSCIRIIATRIDLSLRDGTNRSGEHEVVGLSPRVKIGKHLHLPVYVLSWLYSCPSSHATLWSTSRLPDGHPAGSNAGMQLERKNGLR